MDNPTLLNATYFLCSFALALVALAVANRAISSNKDICTSVQRLAESTDVCADGLRKLLSEYAEKFEEIENDFNAAEDRFETLEEVQETQSRINDTTRYLLLRQCLTGKSFAHQADLMPVNALFSAIYVCASESFVEPDIAECEQLNAHIAVVHAAISRLTLRSIERDLKQFGLARVLLTPPTGHKDFSMFLAELETHSNNYENLVSKAFPEPSQAVVPEEQQTQPLKVRHVEEDQG